MRKNGKEKLINYENSIKKSNELSMAKLNHGLTLNQMQLLAYAIYCTQQNGVTEFYKPDFEKKFGIEKYQTKDARDDSERLLDLKFSTEDLENEKFKFWNVFMGMEYDNGLFKFEWNPKMIPHILELKEKYITTDLTITSQFKSSFSWVLYDYLKAHYGYWHKPISKEALMRLFGVEKRKTYQKNTGRFKETVLDVAIAEINQYTEMEVWYKEIKEGRAIVGFDLHWSTGEKVDAATTKQKNELQTIAKAISENMFNYMNLNNEEYRNEAMDIIRQNEILLLEIKEIEHMQKSYVERLILDANWRLKRLETLQEQDKKGAVPFYNWLEER
jgi:plasmid replication initiation protein